MSNSSTKKQTIIKIPIEYKPLFEKGWREAAVYGGRYSLKSHTIARFLLIRARMQKTRVACFREFQNSIADSSYQLLVDLIKHYNLTDFEATNNSIVNKLNGSDFLFKGLWNNEQSIKSIEGIDVAWCFPAGTMIGDKKIEDIKVGDHVYSYNHKNRNIELRKVLRTTKRLKPQKLYKLLIQSGGRCIIATEEHPIYVKDKGYVPISKICSGDIVYEKIKLTKKHRVLGWLWRDYRDKYTRKKTEICKKWRYILLGLCKKETVRKNEKKQPNEQRAIRGENDKVTKSSGTQAIGSWGKWKGIYHSTKHALQEAGKGLVERAGRSYWKTKKYLRTTNKLQNRFSKYLLYVGNRVRWVGSSWKIIEDRRRQEDYILKERRVDCVEIQEQGNNKQHRSGNADNYVYNLEVEINNNYFANGILSHNCEEAQSISNRSLEVLTPTVRKDGSQIIYTYNRLLEEDPVHNRLVIQGRPNTLIINVNYDIAIKYKMMPDVILQEIEDDKAKRPALYRHKWLGEPYSLEKKIYKNWAIIDSVPHEARLERRGLDFGYTNDPTAIVDVYRYNGGLILDEITYQKGLSNKQIADILNNQETKTLTIADAAEPKSIEEISSYGVSIMAGKKGADSVYQGIQYVQDQRISVTKRSINIIKEYKNYLFLEDKNGKIINNPAPGWDHTMDALRYAINSLRMHEDTDDQLPVEDLFDSDTGLYI